MYDSYDDTPDFYIDIDVSLVMDRRSTLDKKVAVLPLLCAASLLLATFWTHPADNARLKLNSVDCNVTTKRRRGKDTLNSLIKRGSADFRKV